MILSDEAKKKSYLVLTTELRNYPRGTILIESKDGYHLFRPDRVAALPGDSFLPSVLVESNIPNYFEELTEENAWLIDAYSSIILRANKKEGKNTAYPDLFVMDFEWIFLTHQAWARRPKPLIIDLDKILSDDDNIARLEAAADE